MNSGRMDGFARSVLDDFLLRLRDWLRAEDMSLTALEAALEACAEKGVGRKISLQNITRFLSKKKLPASVPRLDTAAAYAAGLGMTLEEFYSGMRRTAMEKRFEKERRQFERLLTLSDEEGISDVIKSIEHAISDADRRRQAKPPPGQGKQAGPQRA